MEAINKKNNKILAEKVVVADNPITRMVGLLGKSIFPSGEGLHIIPCSSIHSFFMKFKFDAIFLDKKNIVRGLVEKMEPSRMNFNFLSYSVLELPEGTINLTETRIGDEIVFLNKK